MSLCTTIFCIGIEDARLLRCASAVFFLEHHVLFICVRAFYVCHLETRRVAT